MITFFTSVFPTPNRDQLSALYSWRLAQIPVIVLGKLDDPVGLVSKFSNIAHVPEVMTARDLNLDSDAPVVKSMIEKALPLIQTPLMGLVNGDILIKEDFKAVLERAINKNGGGIFLSGPRYDIDVRSSISSPEELRAVCRTDHPHQDQSGDIFISTKANFELLSREIPDFLLGRMVWDNWIHWWFENKGIKCYNMTAVLPTFHPNHSYGHIAGDFIKHPSVQHNYALFRRDPKPLPKIGKWPSLSLP